MSSLLLLFSLLLCICADEESGSEGGWKDKEFRPFGRDSRIVSSARGFDFVVPRRDGYISVFLEQYGQWEDPAIDFLTDVIKESFSTSTEETTMISRQGNVDGSHQSTASAISPVFLDLGSNIGVWSLALAKLAGPDGIVYAVDAQMEMMKHLGARTLR